MLLSASQSVYLISVPKIDVALMNVALLIEENYFPEQIGKKHVQHMPKILECN